MSLYKKIESRLDTTLAPLHIEIRDDTGKHINHQNFDDGAHLSSVIVSPHFKGLTLLERHRLVYQALADMIKKEIHAFSMQTFTPEEWQQKGNSIT